MDTVQNSLHIPTHNWGYSSCFSKRFHLLICFSSNFNYSFSHHSSPDNLFYMCSNLLFVTFLILILRSHGISQKVDGKPNVIYMDESRTVKFDKARKDRQRCHQKFKYFNFLPSSATEYSTGCYISPQMPHTRRKRLISTIRS